MHPDRLSQIAREIAANKVDAVVVAGWPPAAVMKGVGVATVIAVGAGDPVATGLIESLARPGGNITGISDNAATLSTKRLGLLKQAVPNIHKVAMLWNKNDLGMTQRYQASADAAKAINVTVQPLGVGEPEDFGDAFAAMDRAPRTRSLWCPMRSRSLIVSAYLSTLPLIAYQPSTRTIPMFATAV
jgi:ABC-type uncharacterized transport system substrate-binding protein